MNFMVVSYVLCLIGAYKYKDYLLLPFIVKTSLSILGLVLYLIFLIHFVINRFDIDYSSIFFFLVITFLYAMVGLNIFFVVSVFRVFQEISAVTSGMSERIVLQPISSQPMTRSTEVDNNHLNLGDQIQTYGYQEQPPAYQLLYPKRDVEIKSD